MVNLPRLSHSSIQTANHCEQQFVFSYVMGIESKTDKWRSTKDLGTAIHDGIASVLMLMGERMINKDLMPTIEEQIAKAVDSALEKHDSMVQDNKVQWTGELDDEYYTEMQYNREIIPQLLRVYLPLMELGTRYVPALKSEFFELDHDYIYVDVDGVPEPVIDDGERDKPLVEYQFEIADVTATGTRIIEGIVDAVLYDLETGQYVLFDWKVRGRMLDDADVAMDIQLPLYATVLNQLATTKARITNTVMCQFDNTPPKPAVLTQKNVPSKSACRSYWEYWWESIPSPLRAKLDSKEWYETMVEGGKLREKSDWMSKVENPVTPDTENEVATYIERSVDNIERFVESGKPIRAWSAHGCTFCQFKKLCLVHRAGGRVQDTLDEYFVKKG